MSALAKPTYTRKVTFEKLLNELSQDDKKAEKELISILVKYSSSPFSDDSWIFDRHSDKAHPDSISFKSFEIMGEMGKYIAKLFMVANLTRGGGIDSVKVLKYYYKFLSENRLNLHQVNKNIFNHYSHSFDTRISKHTKNLLSESYKFQLLSSALQFHSIMNGHPYMAFIDGVDSIENPYDRKSKDSQYKVVDKDVLEKLDAHFNTEKSPLHIRVAYWIMRLYATRPEDTLNYPLECVKTLTEDMATIKHAIVKNSINQGETQYKIGFINTKEPMQKMLFELICKQQIASSSLQIKSKKQNFLFTYTSTEVPQEIRTLSTRVLSRSLKKVQGDLFIPENKHAVPRDFKKTGITMRMETNWTTTQLKQLANHRSYASIDAYSAPSETHMIEKQREILEGNNEILGRFVFKGKIINGIGDKYEKNLLKNPRAHKISDLGYCSDIKGCGNHLECLDCDDLIPDGELKIYYLEQADRYLKIAEKQLAIGSKIDAQDSHHRAALFASLYNKVNNDSTKLC